MQHKKLISVLIFLALAFSFLAWHSIDQAINVPGSSIWLIPTVWVSLLFITICLVIIVVKERRVSELLAVACFLMSLVFIFDLSRIAAFILAILLFSLGLLRIKRDLDLNIKIDIGKSIYAGKAFIVASMAIMISSQYYSEVKFMDTAAFIPKFNLGEGSGSITSGILSTINPQFRSVQNSSLTVDEFLVETQKGQMDTEDPSSGMGEEIDQAIEEKGGNSLTPEQKAAIKADMQGQIDGSKGALSEASQALALKEGKERLSEMAGKTVTGSEKMSDIFSEIVNNKMASYFRPVEGDSMASAFLPLIFTLILFLTIISLANFLWFFFPSLVGGIFRLLVRFEAVKINRVMEEVEKIE